MSSSSSPSSFLFDDNNNNNNNKQAVTNAFLMEKYVDPHRLKDDSSSSAGAGMRGHKYPGTSVRSLYPLTEKAIAEAGLERTPIPPEQIGDDEQWKHQFVIGGVLNANNGRGDPFDYDESDITNHLHPNGIFPRLGRAPTRHRISPSPLPAHLKNPPRTAVPMHVMKGEGVMPSARHQRERAADDQTRMRHFQETLQTKRLNKMTNIMPPNMLDGDNAAAKTVMDHTIVQNGGQRWANGAVLVRPPGNHAHPPLVRHFVKAPTRRTVKLNAPPELGVPNNTHRPPLDFDGVGWGQQQGVRLYEQRRMPTNIEKRLSMRTAEVLVPRPNSGKPTIVVRPLVGSEAARTYPQNRTINGHTPTAITSVRALAMPPPLKHMAAFVAVVSDKKNDYSGTGVFGPTSGGSHGVPAHQMFTHGARYVMPPTRRSIQHASYVGPPGGGHATGFTRQGIIGGYALQNVVPRATHRTLNQQARVPNLVGARSVSVGNNAEMLPENIGRFPRGRSQTLGEIVRNHHQKAVYHGDALFGGPQANRSTVHAPSDGRNMGQQTHHSKRVLQIRYIDDRLTAPFMQNPLRAFSIPTHSYDH